MAVMEMSTWVAEGLLPLSLIGKHCPLYNHPLSPGPSPAWERLRALDDGRFVHVSNCGEMQVNSIEFVALWRHSLDGETGTTWKGAVWRDEGSDGMNCRPWKCTRGPQPIWGGRKDSEEVTAKVSFGG